MGACHPVLAPRWAGGLRWLSTSPAGLTPAAVALLPPPPACCRAVCHSPGDAAALADYQRPKPRDAPYTPTTLVGARLPHVPITVQQPGRLLSGGGSSQHVSSTIDLPAAAGTALLLLLSESQQQAAWEAAAAAAERATGVPVLPVVVAQTRAGTSSNRAATGSSQGTTVVLDGGDGAWLCLRGVAPDGALLVRPDGHIAWRAASSGQGQQQLAAGLERAVRVVMAKPQRG